MTSVDQRGVKIRSLAASYKQLRDQAVAHYANGADPASRASYFETERQADKVFSQLAVECGNDAPTIRRALAAVGLTI